MAIVAVRSVNASPVWSGAPLGHARPDSTGARKRLPVDPGAQPGPGDRPGHRRRPSARARRPHPVGGLPPFSEAGRARPPALLPVTTAQLAPKRRPDRAPLSPPHYAPPPPGAPKPAGDLPVSWRRVPGQRRAQPPPPACKRAGAPRRPVAKLAQVLPRPRALGLCVVAEGAPAHPDVATSVRLT